MRVRGVLWFFCAGLSFGLQACDRDETASDETLATETESQVNETIGAIRNIRFQVSEGTYMTLDVSPDGSWLVFDLLGHVYRLPADGGEAENLTDNTGIALNFQPAFSPDGKEIAFVSDRLGQHQIWIMGVNGQNPRVISDDTLCVFDPVWTPDGRSIIARSQRNCHRGEEFSDGLIAFDVKTGDKSELVDGRAGAPDVSPDGEFVYFHMAMCPGYPVGRNDVVRGCHQVFRKSLTSGRFQSVTPGLSSNTWSNNGGGGGISPQISPNGRFLAFARRIPNGKFDYKGHQFGPRNALWVRDLITQQEKVVMDPLDIDGAEQSPYSAPLMPGYSWTKDSRQIVITRGGKIRRLDVQSGDVSTIEFTALVDRQLRELVKHRVDIGNPSFRALSTRWQMQVPGGELTVLQADGRLWTQSSNASAPRQLMPSSSLMQYSPAISPDHRRIAFSGWQENGAGGIWIVDISGGVPKRVTDEGEYVFPVWIADSELVAVKGGGASTRGRALGENSTYHLVRIDVTTGRIKTLADLTTDTGRLLPYLRPSVTADGTVFYLSDTGPAVLADSNENGSRIEIRSIPASGSEPAVHAVTEGRGEFAVSPEKDFVAFTHMEQVWIRQMPRSKANDELENLEQFDLSIQLDANGGHSLNWRDKNTLEFSSAGRLYSYDLYSRRLDSREIAVQLTRNSSRGLLALVGADIIPIEPLEVIRDGVVIIREGKIDCLGSCDIPTDADIIDVAGKTIMPGIVDTHGHFLHSVYGGFTPEKDYASAAYLAYGITTVQDPASLAYDIYSLGEMTETGRVIGPRIFTTGPILTSSDDEHYSTHTDINRAILSKKNWGAVSIKSFDLPRRDQRQWAAEMSNLAGLNVTAEGSFLPTSLSLVMDGYTGFEHTPVSGVPILYDDAIRFFAQSESVMSLTIGVIGPGPMAEEWFMQESDFWRDDKLRRWTPWRKLSLFRRHPQRPRSDYGFPLLSESIRSLVEMGGSASLGGHGDLTGLSTHWEIWALASAVEPLNVLKIATLDGAAYIGVDDYVGSIAPGKIADLLILNSDPLVSIRATEDIAYVMKSGVLYEANELDQVWPLKVPYGDKPWINADAMAVDVIELR